MKIRVCGCSGGIGEGRKTTSLLVDDTILIDAGTGMFDLPLEALRRIRHVYLSHSHLDHVAGVPLLVDTIFDDLEEPLTIHARAETLEALRAHVFNDVIWPDFSRIPNHDRPVMRYCEMVVGERRTIHGCTVESVSVNHQVPAVGYRIQCAGGSFAFSGDTTTNDAFWEMLNRHDDLDILIVEAAFPERDLELARLACHYCPSLLAADLAKLRHRPEIYLTHLKPGAEEEIVAECRAAMPELEFLRLENGQEFLL
ncbi:MAG TPA: 3',5'-cyclic-nucleotide phosphodiesterase [Thiotrichales bacterium]|nr:3',5'-cyclic-nucleotide phosphodiesterase [Thiotrichales bacterium]